MKKTLLLFAIIFTAIFSFAQVQIDEAPDFEVTTLSGETFILSDFWEQNPDSKVILEFFFADSPMCKETSPIVNDVFKKFGCNEGDVYFLSINVSDNSETTQHYYDTLGLEYPMVSSENGGVTVDTLYNVHAYPTLALMQKELFKPDNDTIWEIDDASVVDSIIVYDSTHFLSRDIWPIINSDSLINVLLSHGLDTVSCSGEDQNNASGIAESLKSNPAIALFPNPAKDQFQIISNSLEGNYQLDVLDMSGKSVIIRNEYFIKNVPQTINTQNLEKGVYIIRLSNAKEQYSDKLLIK